MKDDTAERALLLLSAPEIDDEVVALVRQLGPDGAKTLRAAAYGKEQALTQKQRAHAVELLARAGEIEDTDLQKLVADPAASVRRHALLALQDRGRADLLVASLRQDGLDLSDHAIVLRALARVGQAAHVKGTLEWATERTDVDIRNLAAASLRMMRRRQQVTDDVDDLDRLAEEIRRP